MSANRTDWLARVRRTREAGAGAGLVTGQRFHTSFNARVRKPTADEMRAHGDALVARGMEDDGGRVVPVLISSTLRARDGHVIYDWDTTHFREQNPVVLWAHDRAIPAVGRAPVTYFDINAGELRSLAQFPVKDLSPFGFTIGEMVGRGYLHQPSVGWQDITSSPETDPDVLAIFPRARRIYAELLEFSVLNVEADTASGFGRAVEQARAGGLELTALASWAEQTLDEDKGVAPAHIERGILEDIALRDRAPRKLFTLTRASRTEVSDMDEKELRALISDIVKTEVGDTVRAAVTDAVTVALKPKEKIDMRGLRAKKRADLSLEEKEAIVEEYYEDTSWDNMAKNIMKMLEMVEALAGDGTVTTDEGDDDEGTAAEGDDDEGTESGGEGDDDDEGTAAEGDDDEDKASRAYWAKKLK